MNNNIQEAAEYIRQRCEIVPEVALILGSGLGDYADAMKDKIVFPYQEIPGFHASTAIGHAGQLILGTISGKQVVMMNGRIHTYEGHAMQTVAFPVRVMRALGARVLIVTNACGAINLEYQIGDLMVISDHINLSGMNPLSGPNDETIGPRFPDMTEAYDPELRALAHQTAQELGMKLQEGVYLFTPGPSYETPAEIRMMRTMGADAVGMSTVPEVVSAVHAGMRVLGISCACNMAAGIGAKLNEKDVIDVAARIRQEFQSLMSAIIGKIC